MILLSVCWLFIAVFVGLVAYDAGYARGRDEGSREVYATARRGLFRALRDRCMDPLTSHEARSGAWRVVRQAVRDE